MGDVGKGFAPFQSLLFTVRKIGNITLETSKSKATYALCAIAYRMCLLSTYLSCRIKLATVK